jgi:hypothetical protein
MTVPTGRAPVERLDPAELAPWWDDLAGPVGGGDPGEPAGWWDELARSERGATPTRTDGDTREAAPESMLTPVRRRPRGARVVRPARPGLRLTRRGRLLVGLLAVLAVAVAVAVATARLQALGDRTVPASAPAEVVVAPGETLWGIAERVAPDRDPRDVVAQLRRLNGLPSGEVHAGQRLRLRP